VLNGSPRSNGGAGSAPAEIPGHRRENDRAEGIVAPPNDLVYNTGTATELRIPSNPKPAARRDRVRLSHATQLRPERRQAIRSQRTEAPAAHRAAIVRSSTGTLRDDDVEVPTKTFHKRDFAYWTVTVERPLQLRFQCTLEAISAVAEQKT